MIRKIFFLCSLMLMAVAPMQAQSDEKAAGAAIDTIVRIFSEYEIVDKFVEDIYKKFEKDKKKGAVLATRIAKAYYNYNELPGTKERQFHRRDTVKAFSFIRRALALDNKYVETYLVASDIFNYEGKRDTALIWLDQGINVNPTDSSLYIESAKLLAYTDADAAVKKLLILKERDSTFQVDLQLGRLYYDLYNHHGQLPMNEMAKAYGKVYADSIEREKMNLGDLGAFSFALQWASEVEDRFNKQYEVTNYGLSKFPQDFGLRQFHFNSCWSTERWDEGIKTAEQMFAMPDSVRKVGPEDYLRYGHCLRGAKRYNDAIAQYDKVAAMEDATATQKSQAESSVVTTVSAQVSEMRKMGDYEQAIALVEPLVQKYREKGKQNDNLMVAYATIYTDWSTELNGLEKQDVLRKASQIFGEAADHSELNTDLFIYRQYNINFILDPELKDGLAMPQAQKLIDRLGSKANLESNERIFLNAGYEYMLRHEYFIKKNKKKAIEIANKMLDVDPSNQVALRFITALGG